MLQSEWSYAFCSQFSLALKSALINNVHLFLFFHTSFLLFRSVLSLCCLLFSLMSLLLPFSSSVSFSCIFLFSVLCLLLSCLSFCFLLLPSLSSILLIYFAPLACYRLIYIVRSIYKFGLSLSLSRRLNLISCLRC